MALTEMRICWDAGPERQGGVLLAGVWKRIEGVCKGVVRRMLDRLSAG